MAYKDKDRQRQADKARQQRRRDRIKAKGVTSKGVTQGVTVTSIANEVTARLNISNYGQPDCECKHCQQNRANGSKRIVWHGTYKPANQLAKNEINRVPLLGDPDYRGVADLHPEWPRVG